MNRRDFLTSAMCSTLLAGVSASPRIISPANAMSAGLDNRFLINLFLDGGPDFRHLIVPEFDDAQESYGNKFWKHRARSFRLSTTNQNAWRDHWLNEYIPFTVGVENWPDGLVDSGGLNQGVTFGIWREAGWLIDMFSQGNVALIFNAGGGTNRAHDLSSLMLQQGNLDRNSISRTHSGWGGRLARSAEGNIISVTNSPSPFCFGPVGESPGYDITEFDNTDIINLENSRRFGLFDFDLDQTNQFFSTPEKMTRAVKSYYAALAQEQTAAVYDKFLDHESKLRRFAQGIRDRLDETPVPEDIQALYQGVVRSDLSVINPDPNNLTNPRQVLRSSGFGRQFRNIYDTIASSDLLNPRVASMIYGGWDSHGNQRQVPVNLETDPNNPFAGRGIEGGFKDIFGGKFGDTPSDPAALHYGFSALWNSVTENDRSKMVVTVAGEFGRQIRSNGDRGTDHGGGNLMFVIGEQVAGGVYGEVFPEEEVDKYDNFELSTPDISLRTEIDPFYAATSEWVVPNSGNVVFPRMATIGDPEVDESDKPKIESGVTFENLFESA